AHTADKPDSPHSATLAGRTAPPPAPSGRSRSFFRMVHGAPASVPGRSPGGAGPRSDRARGARFVEVDQHPGVAQGVRLDPLQVEEFGDALVVGAQELLVDPGRDGGALDRLEAVPAEEGGLEGEAEDPADAEFAGAGEELGDY